jgi:GNAT superfamily N-acetyltransferase
MRNHVNADSLLPANQDDVPELAALARDRLPSMLALHSEAGWHRFNRFGNGQRARGNCTLVLRDGDERGPLIGFVWTDDAMRVDYGIVEPWWCINALAIAPQYSSTGRGTALVNAVTEAARSAGVVQLYGQTVPTAVDFWMKAGFTVADDAEELRSDYPALSASGDRLRINAASGPGDRWFVKTLLDVPGTKMSLLAPASQVQSR